MITMVELAEAEEMWEQVVAVGVMEDLAIMEMEVMTRIMAATVHNRPGGYPGTNAKLRLLM